MPDDPSEDEVIGYMQLLDDRARWGLGNELGTLNLITPETRLRALSTVRDGLTIGCARPIVIEPDAEDVIDPPIHEIVETHPMTDRAPRITTASDRFGLPGHGVTITHVDSLSHFQVDGLAYHGPWSDQRTAGDDPMPGSVDALRDGILTRGVLVDMAAARAVPFLAAGEGVRPADIEAWEAVHDVRLEPGDALLLRTGWAGRRATLGPYPGRKPRPGLHAAMLPWLHERGVAVVVSDAAHDVVPSGYARMPMPIHTVGLRAMGLCLVDNADLDSLAAACAARDRWTCLFILAPLRLVNGTGSPVTPLAVL